MGGKVLLSPALTKGNGTGHLKRCLSLARKLDGKACILYGLSSDEQLPVIKSYGEMISFDQIKPGENYDFILLDRRSTGLRELESLRSHGPVIGLDEGGAARDFMPYLIDTLPGSNPKTAPNVASTGFLDLAKSRKTRFDYPFRRILVSFGGEDPASLTPIFLKEVLRTGFFDGCALSIVEGPAFCKGEAMTAPEAGISVNVSTIHNPENLKEMLHGYDLVITSFGLTCFESLSAGVPVILLNPTRYHNRLSQRAEIPQIGVGKPNMAKLARLLDDPDLFKALLATWNARFSRTGPPLEEFLLTLDPANRRDCPVCGTGMNRSVARFRSRTYFRCRHCGVVYLLSFSREEKKYEEDYFGREYERQYGRTYLQDFEAIKVRSRERLRIILRLKEGKGNKTLLDVGCAFGPFLQAARESGFLSRGVDISERAASYVRTELGIPCVRQSFSDYEGEGTDILTMWYVIEHFKEVGSILRKVNHLLPIGGIFALSTPNCTGVSGRLSLGGFLQSSPPDHLTVWSPANARKLLGRFGFTTRFVRVTGHHPERFSLFRKFKPGGLLWKWAERASRLLALGDTFELYAVKERNFL